MSLGNPCRRDTIVRAAMLTASAIAASVAPPAAAVAEVRNWNVGNALWSQSSSWNPAGVPGPADEAYVYNNAAGLARINTTAINPVAQVVIGNNATVHISNQGSLQCNTDFVVGAQNVRGNFNVLTNNFLLPFPGGVWVGRDLRLGLLGGQGYMSQDAGSVIVARDLYLGESNSATTVGYGQLTLSGTGLLQADRMLIGNTNDASGYLNLGGSASVSVGQLLIGASRYGGTVNQTGGQVNVAAHLRIDSSSLIDSGRYTLAGGSLTSAATTIYSRAILNYSAGSVSLGNLFMNGGTIKLSPHGNKVLRARTLFMDNNALIELANNSMLLTDDTPDAVQFNIRSAYADGEWTGAYGITSSFAAATALLGLPHRTALGYGPVAEGTLVTYTYEGDATLDGIVNLADFNRLAANFGQTFRHWYQGDFNYDGIVNLADFNRLASNFGLSAGPEGPTPDDWAALASAVPEPAEGLLLVTAGVGAMRRRRGCTTRDSR